MKHELIKKAAEACKKAYRYNINIGSTEYNFIYTPELQILAIPGTNELLDWFWNFMLYAKEGVKRCSHLSAQRIHEQIKQYIIPTIPLMVTGHSKAGPTAVWYKYKYGADYCVAFCPAPGFRRWKAKEMGHQKNTLLVLDPDDFVINAGRLNFTHPDAKTITLPKDKKWFDIAGRIADHDLNQVTQFI